MISRYHIQAIRGEKGVIEETLVLPDSEFEDDEILEWRVKNLPEQLLSCLHRFTRIPNADSVLPIIVAYELMPLLGLNVTSGLFCYGASGSGKSTINDLLQLLNPCYDGNTKPLSAMDSPNGWLQSLSRYRWQNLDGTVKPCPFVAIDDLTSKTLLGHTGNTRLQIIKQLPNRNGMVSKGTADGTPMEFHTFSKFSISSITDLGGIEGLSELNRRLIVIKHKPLPEWSEYEFVDSNRGIFLEKYRDFSGWEDYPKIKSMWLQENREHIVKHRTAVRRYFKKNRENYPIPDMLTDFYNPIIAMGLTCGLWNIEQGIEVFRTMIENSTRKGNDSHLNTILKQWLSLDEGYGKMLRRFERNGCGFEVDYSRLVKFLKLKVSENELNHKEIQRQNILGALSDLGYVVTIQNASPLIEMVGRDDEPE